MTRLPLSISIISQNEEANLRRCLASAAELAQEIVIVDSGSTDRTAEIAAEFGVKFVYQDWLGYTAQKNHCLALCSQPWILALDCDEELTPELRESIQRFFENGDHEKYDGAWMPRLVWFMGRWIHHGDWYPDRKVRSLPSRKEPLGRPMAAGRCMSGSCRMGNAPRCGAICCITHSKTSSTTS
jgi:glycosyltransferase involved in cell wall biosynthesis